MLNSTAVTSMSMNQNALFLAVLLLGTVQWDWAGVRTCALDRENGW